MEGGLKSVDVKAGCAKCGACSALSTFERGHGRRRGVRRVMFDTVKPFTAPGFQIKHAVDPWEREGAAALRRRVFCREQGLFGEDDRDAIDETAIPIVALALWGVYADAVVGTVRIHEEEPGLWWGSRLAVANITAASARWAPP